MAYEGLQARFLRAGHNFGDLIQELDRELARQVDVAGSECFVLAWQIGRTQAHLAEGQSQAHTTAPHADTLTQRAPQTTIQNLKTPAG